MLVHDFDIGLLTTSYKCLPLGVKAHQLQRWDETPALAALAYSIAKNR
jgi:hypothetical protein